MKPVILAAACATIVGIAYGMHSPIVPVFAKEELGANFSEVGVIGLANYLPYMLVPVFGGMLLDRINKSYMLMAGISMNIVSIFLLSQAGSVAEVLALRGLAGIAHAFFWPSTEVIISTNVAPEKRVKWISFFMAAWVGGFMTGPLIGNFVLDFFDQRTLFELSAAAISFAMVPAFLLVGHGKPKSAEKHRLPSLSEIKRETMGMPDVSSVLLYYAVTFGVVLAIYPAYMKTAAITDQQIELLFFVFGIARFATLPFVQRMASRGRPALALAVALTALGMGISFAYTSVWSFAVALVLVGAATSIFYPITFSIVTRNVPPEKMGSKLGIYEALFGMGWTVGPIGIGLSSDAFGPASPYLGLAVIGAMLSVAIILKGKS
ncbi:MFS transporter [Candidatus Nitrososphaera sp. FF02]|uniref:MFS transporter n=1 Tax=Candidatus Nitrososphaera sp. FF02 TaxID=3398226 RepID=UPI0039EA2FD1